MWSCLGEKVQGRNQGRQLNPELGCVIWHILVLCAPGEHTFYSKFFQNYPLSLKSSKKSYFGKSGKIGLVFYCSMGSAKSYAQIYF